MTQNSNMKNNARKIIIGTLGIAISLISLFFVFRNIELGKLLKTVNRIEILPMLLSVALYWGGLVTMRTLLVKYILSSKGHIPFYRAYRCIAIGFLANNILPFRIGDVARGAAVSNAGKIKFSTVMGGMALERMLDFLMAALVAFGAIITVPYVPDSIKTTAFWAAAVLSTALLLFIILVRFNHSEKEQKNLLSLVWNLWVRFSSGFNTLRTFKGVVIILFIGVILWSFGIASITARLASFGLPVSIPSSLLVFACLGFGVALPSAPGYVGVYQIAAVIALTALGVDETIAAAFGLYSWIVDISAGNIAGAIGMVLEGMSLKDLKKAGSS
ncbi:MAG: flippase-like domain-containing protein [Deltaproteobacteria bacterium]|nr:flippase-like domain-containing protein [Deltaproteobacteria bacterium]